MNKLILPFFVSVLVFSGCSNRITAPGNSNIDLSGTEKQVLSSSQQFGFDLFKEINKTSGDSNIFISPLSISTAFGMLLNGAAGQTYEAIKSTLKLPGSTPDQINNAYKNLNIELTRSDPDVIFNTANSIWYKQGFTFEGSFFDVNKNYFGALIQGLDFSDPASVNIINNWVDEKTNGKITSIIDRITPDAVMYLINAIYFKGTWLYRFDSTATKQADFYVTPANPQKCMMMNLRDTLNYHASGEYQAVELPYGNGNFSMIVVLPASPENLNPMINQMNDNFWTNMLGNMKRSVVNLWLPKFKLEYKIELSKILSEMGMGIVFGTSADFSKISSDKGLSVSSVLHKTYLDVNEQGTEAAAVTAITVTVTVSTGEQNIYMRVDRPFILAIMENNTGTILFMGKISSI